MQWCRLYAEITRDPKTARLSDGAFRLFVELMALAAEAEADGDTKLSREDIDWTLRRPACEFLSELESRALAGVSPGGTVFVTNWGKRQSRSDSSTPRVQAHRERQASVAETNAKRSGNGPEKIREEQKREEQTGAGAPAWVPADAWEAFLDMRKKLRKPPTDNAKALLLKKLEKLRDEGWDPRAILENSTRNSWQDIFEPKGEKPKVAAVATCCSCHRKAIGRQGGASYCADHMPIQDERVRALLSQTAAARAA